LILPPSFSNNCLKPTATFLRNTIPSTSFSPKLNSRSINLPIKEEIRLHFIMGLFIATLGILSLATLSVSSAHNLDCSNKNEPCLTNLCTNITVHDPVSPTVFPVTDRAVTLYAACQDFGFIHERPNQWWNSSLLLNNCLANNRTVLVALDKYVPTSQLP
jgi:hypothetical protein